MKLLSLAFQHNCSQESQEFWKQKFMCVSFMENPWLRIKSDSRNSFRLPKPQKQSQPCSPCAVSGFYFPFSHGCSHPTVATFLGLLRVRISSFALDFFFLFYFEMWDMLFAAHQKFWVFNFFQWSTWNLADLWRVRSRAGSTECSRLWGYPNLSFSSCPLALPLLCPSEIMDRSVKQHVTSPWQGCLVYPTWQFTLKPI